MGASRLQNPINILKTETDHSHFLSFRLSPRRFSYKPIINLPAVLWPTLHVMFAYTHCTRWRRQRSKGARSFRGQKILQPGHPDAVFLKKVDDPFLFLVVLVALKIQTANAVSPSK